MNKRTVILIAICCLLAVATVTMRYIKQEIALIRAKFIGDKKTEERAPRGIGSARPAPVRAPQIDKAPAAVKQNTVRPPKPGAGQSPPATVAAPAASRVITPTSVVPGKAMPTADALRQANKAVPVEEITTPLETEPAAVAAQDEAPRGADSAATAAVDRPDAPAEEAAPGAGGAMREAPVERESDDIQGEEAAGEDEPAPAEETEEGEQVEVDEESSPGSEEPAAETAEDVVDEE